jgi:hypothetical protein
MYEKAYCCGYKGFANEIGHHIFSYEKWSEKQRSTTMVSKEGALTALQQWSPKKERSLLYNNGLQRLGEHCSTTMVSKERALTAPQQWSPKLDVHCSTTMVSKVGCSLLHNNGLQSWMFTALQQWSAKWGQCNPRRPSADIMYIYEYVFPYIYIYIYIYAYNL